MGGKYAARVLKRTPHRKGETGAPGVATPGVPPEPSLIETTDSRASTKVRPMSAV